MKKNKPYGAAAALLAGALLGGLMTAPGAHAVDFRVKGVWIAMLEYGDGGSFVRKDREGKNVQGWGRWGEDRAAEYLESQGYGIMARDWRAGRRDIDIVAHKDGTVAFVEVKTRRDAGFG